jgi:serine/threonine protein phosphatase PrpC
MATLRRKLRTGKHGKKALSEDPLERLKTLEKDQRDLVRQIEKFTRLCGEDHGTKGDARNEQRLQQLENQESQLIQQIKDITESMEEAAQGRRDKERKMKRAATMSRAAGKNTQGGLAPGAGVGSVGRSSGVKAMGSVGRSGRSSRRRAALVKTRESGRDSGDENSRSGSNTPTLSSKNSSISSAGVGSVNSTTLDGLAGLAAELDTKTMFEPTSKDRPAISDLFGSLDTNSAALTTALEGLDVVDEGDAESDRESDGESDGEEVSRYGPRSFPRGPVDFSHADFKCEVVRDFANAEDMNLPGLQRAKKGKRAGGMGANASGKITYQMEDQMVCLCPVARNELEHSAFFGVMDGHIDKNAAFAAKQLLPLHFVRHLAAATKANDGVIPPDLTDEFFAAFKSCDGDLKKFEFEGCTATAVYVWRSGGKRYIQCANVGDSTAFLYRRKRKPESSSAESSDDEAESEYEAHWLSVDHKVSSKEERARFQKAGIQIAENATRLNGLAVSRSLGDHFAKDNNTGVIGVPFVSAPLEISNSEDGVFLVLASDGLWDVLSGQRACEIALSEKGLSAQQQAEKLLKVALAPSKNHDNITITCVQLV